jgi:diacylglycerol kinase family enzyme
VEATAEILESLRADRIRSVGLGTASARLPGDEGWTPPRWFVFAAGLGFDAEVIERVERRRAGGHRSTGGLYVREATTAFLLGRDRRRPAMTLQPAEGEPVGTLFLCLFSNVSPWTYLGARPVQPSPQASFDTGIDVFALARRDPLRMLGTVRQVLAREPAPHGRGLHAWHDLRTATVEASRPLGWQLDGDHLGTAEALRVEGVASALRVIT